MLRWGRAYVTISLYPARTDTRHYGRFPVVIVLTTYCIKSKVVSAVENVIFSALRPCSLIDAYQSSKICIASIFRAGDGGHTLTRNYGNRIQEYTASWPRRSLPPPWKPQIPDICCSQVSFNGHYTYIKNSLFMLRYSVINSNCGIHYDSLKFNWPTEVNIVHNCFTETLGTLTVVQCCLIKTAS